jgi:hypothetical protein
MVLGLSSSHEWKAITLSTCRTGFNSSTGAPESWIMRVQGHAHSIQGALSFPVPEWEISVSQVEKTRPEPAELTLRVLAPPGWDSSGS